MSGSGDLLAGRYRVGEVLGTGGMGTVVRAHDEVLERPVAIKFLRDELAGHGPAADRFRREARIAASLAHPGIAQVYDFAVADGRPFIVMELLDGTDLHALMAAGEALDPAVAAGIVARAAEALGSAHAAGAVHRDVKPANIVLTRAGAVKVTDFGVAFASQQTPITETGRMLGTSWYASPEQARGERAGPPSDVYALGCVLFHLLARHPPFEAETPVGVAMAHVSDPVPSARDANPAVPEALDAVVRRAMAKDPAARYPDGTAMAVALEAAGTAPLGSAVPPRPPAVPVAVGAGEAPTGVVRVGPPTARLFTPSGDVALGVPPPAPDAATSVPRPPRRRGSHSLVAFVALLLIGLAAIVLLGVLNRPDPVLLPDWTGKSSTAASGEARRLGLEVRGQPQSSVEPKDVVLGQDPPPRTSVPAGSRVTLAVSLGDQVRVPKVTGGTFGEAKRVLTAVGLKAVVARETESGILSPVLRQLRNLGLDLGVIERFMGETEERVVEQDQPPGTPVARGSTVRLTIEKAPVDRDGGRGKDGKKGGGGD